MNLRMPRGPGMLLLGSQMVPVSLHGRLSWGAAYLGGAHMSEQIASLRAAGAHDIYLWAHPSAWLVTNFESSVAQAERLCAAHSLTGYIADPESPGTSSAQAFRFGSLLKESVRKGLSVGCASYATFGVLEDFAEGCDGAVWGVCEIHNRGSDRESDFDAWFARFRELFGSAIPCIATYIPPTHFGEELREPDGYEAYLAKIPNAQAWCSFGVGPDFMYERLATWRQSGPFDNAMWLIGIPTIAHVPVWWTLVLLVLLGAAIFLTHQLRKRYA